MDASFQRKNDINKSIYNGEERLVNRRKSNIAIFDQDIVRLHASKRDIENKKHTLRYVINSVEDNVTKREDQRDYKMKLDYERERDFIVGQQTEIKKSIESMSINNANERLIQFLKNEVNNQQDLFNKYYTLNAEISRKIKSISDVLPDMESNIKEKSESLKSLNYENLKLMEKISQLEKEKLDVQKKMSNESFERSNVNNKSNLRGSKILTRREETDLDSKTINITDLIEENESLKAKYNYIQYLKNKLHLSKKENIQLSSDINDKNTEVFQLSKIFTEGMHEISKELLKVHEMQLDKATSSNLNGSSLYFELIKEKSLIGNGSTGKYYNNMDESVKLPMIRSNITSKYHYPIIEKYDPSTSIYDIIKKMLDEHNHLSKIANNQQKKIDWEEFKDLNGYQIYTLLSLNRDVLKILESKIIPRKFTSFSKEKDTRAKVIKVDG